ncbi:MAG: hypothetical protein P8077_09935 [Gammaproteobacteria bacterium]
MDNRINPSNWTQGLHQAAHENQANIPNSFSELHPISNLTEYLVYPYHRVEISATADLRGPSSTSIEVQLSGEQNNTTLTQGHLEPSKIKQKLVPVPPEFRHNNENEFTLISPKALVLRKRRRERIPVPPEFRHNNENEHTQISPNALTLRKRNRGFVPVPPEFRYDNEDEHTKIRPDTLYQRKRRKLKSAAISGEKPHAPPQAGETSAANTLADSNTLADRNSARQNSPILTRSSSGSNASALHETTPQGTMEIYESLSPLGPETVFSHWLDDVDA